MTASRVWMVGDDDVVGQALRLMPLLFVLSLAACTATDSRKSREAADHYAEAVGSVHVGMREEPFLALMAPAMEARPGRETATRYARGGQTYTVYLPQSKVIRDGAVTDDEFTPYFFLDGRLSAIGWDFMGGPRYTSRDVQREKEALRDRQIKASNEALLNNPNNQINCGTTGGTNPFC